MQQPGGDLGRHHVDRVARAQDLGEPEAAGGPGDDDVAGKTAALRNDADRPQVARRTQLERLAPRGAVHADAVRPDQPCADRAHSIEELPTARQPGWPDLLETAADHVDERDAAGGGAHERRALLCGHGHEQVVDGLGQFGNAGHRSENRRTWEPWSWPTVRSRMNAVSPFDENHAGNGDHAGDAITEAGA